MFIILPAFLGSALPGDIARQSSRREPYERLAKFNITGAVQVSALPAELDALTDAARAYWDFLDRNALIDEVTANGEIRIKASALAVTVTFDEIDVILKDGACDRVYGNGQNPDPCGAGPGDIPHQPRDDII